MRGVALKYIFKNIVRSAATGWIFPALDRDKWRSLVTTVAKVWIP
jgi:hypothetical protein